MCSICAALDWRKEGIRKEEKRSPTNDFNVWSSNCNMICKQGSSSYTSYCFIETTFCKSGHKRASLQLHKIFMVTHVVQGILLGLSVNPKKFKKTYDAILTTPNNLLKLYVCFIILVLNCFSTEVSFNCYKNIES